MFVERMRMENDDFEFEAQVDTFELKRQRRKNVEGDGEALTWVSFQMSREEATALYQSLGRMLLQPMPPLVGRGAEDAIDAVITRAQGVTQTGEVVLCLRSPPELPSEEGTLKARLQSLRIVVKPAELTALLNNITCAPPCRARVLV